MPKNLEKMKRTPKTTETGTETIPVPSGSDARQFFRYVIPTMCFMFVAGMYNIFDSIFIGLAAGETGLAACLLTFPLYCAVFGLGDLVGVGGSILIAQYFGEGKPEEANRIYSGMFGLLVILSCTLIGLYAVWGRSWMILSGATPELLPYSMQYFGIIVLGSFPILLWLCLGSIMRSDGQPVLASILIVFSCGMNIFLDYLFVLRLGWGVPGAAFATVLSEILALGVCAYFFMLKRSTLKFYFSDFFPKWSTAWKILRNGFPSWGAHLAIGVMLLFHNLQALHWGGAVALAAYAAICTIESLASMLMQGVASGLQPLVSFYYGANDFARNRRFVKYGYFFTFFLGVLGVFFSVLMCRILPGLMGLEGETAEIAARGLILSAPAFLALGIVKVGSHYYQATGRVISSAILIYGDCVILPICLLVLPLVFALDGVWLAMPFSRFVLLGILILMGFLPACRLKSLSSKTAEETELEENAKTELLSRGFSGEG